jgi:hypothetical protein
MGSLNTVAQLVLCAFGVNWLREGNLYGLLLLVAMIIARMFK